MATIEVTSEFENQVPVGPQDRGAGPGRREDRLPETRVGAPVSGVESLHPSSVQSHGPGHVDVDDVVLGARKDEVETVVSDGEESGAVPDVVVPACS